MTDNPPAFPQKEFLDWLTDEIVCAKENAIESGKAAMNSYGAGFDQGYLDGLRDVKRYLVGETT